MARKKKADLGEGGKQRKDLEGRRRREEKRNGNGRHRGERKEN